MKQVENNATTKPGHTNSLPIFPTKEDVKSWTYMKGKYTAAIVLMKTGDHYFSFDEDSKMIIQAKGIESFPTNNPKGCYIRLAAFDNALHQLLKSGHNVVICEQPAPR